MNQKQNFFKTNVIMILIIISLILSFTNCDNTALLNSSIEDSVQNDEDFIDTNGDHFVNGLNQSYMAENGLTEDQMFERIEQQIKNDTSNTIMSKGSGNSDLFNIMLNFDEYFTFYINDFRNSNNSTTSAEIRLGLNTELLKPLLADYSNVVKDTDYNYQRIYSFSIEKLDNQFLYLKGRLHVKSWTAGPFGTRIKLADKKADIFIKLEFLFDQSTNGVGYKYDITKVDMDRKWTDIFFVALAVIYPPIGVPSIILNETHRFIVKRKILSDGKDMFYIELGRYVDPEYFTIRPITSSSTWMYFNFAATSKGISLIRTLGEMLFNQTKVIYRIYRDKRVYAEADALLYGVVNNGVDYRGRNFGSSTKLITSAWTYQGNPGYIRSLIKFPTSQIPATTTSAKLYLFGIGEHDPLNKSNETYVQRVTSTWSENTVTWNNQPTTTTSGQELIGSLSNNNPNAYVDITTWAKRWASPISLLRLNNYGLMLKLKAENYYTKMTFGSSENETTSKRPYLLIRYHSERSHD